MALVLEGTKGLMGLLLDMSDAVVDGDYEPALLEIKDELQEQHAQMFATQESADGTPWEPLAEATVRQKGHSRILYNVGDLLDSLAEESAAGSIREIDALGLTFGTDDPKAFFHQEGTSQMPARPPVGISEETEERVAEIISERTLELSLEEVRA